MTARQMAFRGVPEHAGAARRWVAGEAGHPDAGLLAAELWNAVAAACPETILMTVSAQEAVLRITAYGSRPVGRGALTDLSARILSSLAVRFGADTTRHACGLWAEITR